MPGASGRVTIERLTQYSGTDLDDLCEATEHAIVEGGGFGWVKVPARQVLENYWKGVLLMPDRHLVVGRLDGVIAGSAQLSRAPRNNEAQAFAGTITGAFVAPWARGHGLAAGSCSRSSGWRAELGLVGAQPRSARHPERRDQALRRARLSALGHPPRLCRGRGEVVPGHYYYKRLRRAWLIGDPVPGHRPERRRLRPPGARRDGERDGVQRRSRGAGPLFRRTRFPWLHVVDLDGAFAGGSVNGDAVRAIRRAVDLKIELGGGIRDRAAIDYWLDLGIERVVLGTAALRDPDLVRCGGRLSRPHRRRYRRAGRQGRGRGLGRNQLRSALSSWQAGAPSARAKRRSIPISRETAP